MVFRGDLKIKKLIFSTCAFENISFLLLEVTLNIFQFRKLGKGAYPGKKTVGFSEAVCRMDKFCSRIICAVAVALCIAHINRTFYIVSFDYQLYIVTLAESIVAPAEVILKIFMELVIIKKSFDIALLAVAYYEKAVIFAELFQCVFQLGIQYSAVNAEIIIFMAAAFVHYRSEERR